MKDLFITNKLRPTRIGFLVRPSDRASIRKIMRINACLWGGLYNPIIPVFRRPPSAWKNSFLPHEKITEIITGYIRFFEPDVYVESERGLIEKAGLSNIKIRGYEANVCTLDEFFENKYRAQSQPKFGLSIRELIADIYEKERKFELKKETTGLLSSDKRVLSEILLGVYPTDTDSSNYQNDFEEVFDASYQKMNADTWQKIFSRQVVTPFSTSSKHLTYDYRWHDEPVIYFFDQKENTDLIDLWNSRCIARPVLPAPIELFDDIKVLLKEFIERHHRPANNNGVMLRVSLRFSLSISEQFKKNSLAPFLDNLKKGSFNIEDGQERFWAAHKLPEMILKPKKLIATANESTKWHAINDENILSTEIESISPEFAELYSGVRSRWANVLNINSVSNEEIASSLPHNILDREWLRGRINSSEGIVYLQDFKHSAIRLELMRNNEALLRWLQWIGVKAKISEAGRIAKQILDNLGGFWGLYLFDDLESLKFVNKLAHSSRLRTKDKLNERYELEEEFPGRTATFNDWNKMIKTRQSQGAHDRVNLDSYIKKNVIKAGLQTECLYCSYKNWHSLDVVQYKVICERCLKEYPFPQSAINTNIWRYRLIGPFTASDYAQGAYASLLTIRFFKKLNTMDGHIGYSTAIELVLDDKDCEVDFMIWHSKNEMGVNQNPELIFGEAKSFGIEAIKQKDISQLKRVANQFPNSILVVSVLKESFSKNEKILLEQFVRWSRRNSKHRIILLTATELFSEFISEAWKKKGGKHREYAELHTFYHGMDAISDATIDVNLGVKPSWTKLT